MSDGRREQVGVAPQSPEAATISFGGGATSCTVGSLSDGGASLEVGSPIGILDPIVLELKAFAAHAE